MRGLRTAESIGCAVWIGRSPDHEPLAAALREGGWEVVGAERAEAAVRAVADSLPDLVIVDLAALGTGGLDVLRALRADVTVGPVPLLALAPAGWDDGELHRTLAGLADDWTRHGAGDADLRGRAALLARLARAESANRQTRRCLEEVIRHAAAPILSWDGDGRVQSLSPAAEHALGVAAAEAVGRRAVDVLGDCEQARAHLVRSLDPRAPRRFEVDTRSRSGRPLRWTVARLPGPPLGGGGAVAIAQDEAAPLPQAAPDAHQEHLATLGRLVAEITHEMGNPLHQVAASLHVLRDPGTDPEQRAEIVDDMAQAVRRLIGFSEQLRDLGRPASRRRAPVPVRRLLQSALCELRPRLRERGIALQEALAADCAVLCEEPGLIGVFSNLIGNAIDALADREGARRIAISTEVAGAVVRCRVADNGPGIAPDLLGRVFEPFYTTKAGRGVGLGLAIAYRAVLDHGGSLWVESRPDVETCFWVELPIAAGAGPGG